MKNLVKCLPRHVQNKIKIVTDGEASDQNIREAISAIDFYEDTLKDFGYRIVNFDSVKTYIKSCKDVKNQ